MYTHIHLAHHAIQEERNEMKCVTSQNNVCIAAPLQDSFTNKSPKSFAKELFVLFVDFIKGKKK